jgi:hypothetical protein
VIARHDVPALVIVIFRKKLAECGVKGDWLKWETQMHCFPLTFPYHIREAIDAIAWIIYTDNSNIQQNERLLANYQG